VFENTFLPSELSELVGGFAATTEHRDPDEIHGLKGSGSATCVIGDTIYVLGGMDGNYRRIPGPAMYSTLTDTWDTTSLPQMPGDYTRDMCSAVPVGISKIYLLGGGRNSMSNDMLLLDLETTPARWINLVDAQCPRHSYSASCEINGVIYMFGGMQKRNGRWSPVDSVYTYNTKSDRPHWKVLGTRMPAATLSDRNGIVVYDDKIYLFGYNDVHTRETILTVFDPLKESFVQLASHPSEFEAMYPFLLGDDHIYVVHGYGQLISKYDVERDMWEILDVEIPSERRLWFNVVSV
jgi:N-acetylneuraminic acid mutarotase